MLRSTSLVFVDKENEDQQVDGHRLSVRRSSLAVDMSRRMPQRSNRAAPLLLLNPTGDELGMTTISPNNVYDNDDDDDDDKQSGTTTIESVQWSYTTTEQETYLGGNVKARNRTGSKSKLFLEDYKDEDSDPSALSSPTTPLRRDDEMSTLYFSDGIRRIDFVLAYEDGDYRKVESRKLYQENLRKEGLQTELEDKTLSQDGKTYFLKIHAPHDILKKHAEVLNMKRPIKEEVLDDGAKKGAVFSMMKSLKHMFNYNDELIPDDIDAPNNKFNCKHKKNSGENPTEMSFTDAHRSRIVWEILIRTPYHGDGRASTGILYLVSNGTYTAAYPLHDGPYGKGAYRPDEECTERRLLYSEWARAACWYKRQPLGLIRRYFGEKTSLYFAWLGFYTTMLIPAALLGLLTMIYGICTMNTNIASKEICDAEGPGTFPMCPLCDKRCDYWELKEGCLFSKIVNLFDNPATVGFAVFMSLWATMFMELWKRKQATLAWEWSLADLDYGMDQIRPEYESSVKHYRLNPVTMAIEPFLPFRSKVARIAGANTAVLFVLCLLMATVFGLIVYRIIIVTVLTASDQVIWRTYAKITTSITASVLNLIVIIIMDKVYRALTDKLTNLERPRTQREYEDSFTFKMFLFEFINMYSSLIYIAFFKGRFFGHPGDTFTLFGYRQDQCELGGCLFEVCVQLAIIMVGKQILNNISELSWAEIMNWWKRWWRARDGPKNRIATTQWEKDYNLLECDRMALFDEYLEMVIQFGFVTLFVAAFPLAPLFALLNNIVEIRLDAYKYVTQLRRPLTARVPNIGAWQAILKGISVFAVISNAFMIAYTSDFIPRLVYVFVYSPDRSLRGYINNSLSYFDVRDFPVEAIPESPVLQGVNVTICRYQDYRHPPEDLLKYKLNMKYWHIFAARLSFVVVFEHLVFFVTGLLAYVIPDIPRSVQQKIQRKRFLAREALYRTEIEQCERQVIDTVDGDGAALPL